MLLNIDIYTLALVQSLANLLQVIALLAQYRMDRTMSGVGWWVLGSASLAAGFAMLLLRDAEQIGLPIMAANSLIVGGQILLYIGVIRFLGKKENKGIVVTFFSVFVLLFFYYTYFTNGLSGRIVVVSMAAAVISMLTAYNLFDHRNKRTAFGANFTSIAFLVFGCFVALRALLTLISPPTYSYFDPVLIQIAAFLVPIITSTLWTFGFILLVNQRLNVENREAKEQVELIFNTSPDAVLITRLADGHILNINEGFTALTGFTRADALDKSSLDINIWKDPADRQRVVSALNEKGACENLEAVFQRKDGSHLVGMLSARLIDLRGVPHIISVTRDITERKKAEESLRESEEKFRMLAENVLDVLWVINLNTRRRIFTSPSIERLLGYSAEELLAHPVDQAISTELTFYEQAHIAEREERFLRGTSPSENYIDEIEQTRKDGSRVWTEVGSQYKRNEKGEIILFGISRDISQRKHLADELLRQATTDDLTAISNRRHFQELAFTELKRAIRFAHPLALLMMDMDRLKFINDTYGHAVGDEALLGFTRICQKNIREIDLLARFGGDEFVLLLPETNCDQACEVAERLRLSLTAQPVVCADIPVRISVSVGVSSLKSDQETLETLLARADQALYQAKEGGRNRIVCSG